MNYTTRLLNIQALALQLKELTKVTRKLHKLQTIGDGRWTEKQWSEESTLSKEYYSLVIAIQTRIQAL